MELSLAQRGLSCNCQLWREFGEAGWVLNLERGAASAHPAVLPRDEDEESCSSRQHGSCIVRQRCDAGWNQAVNKCLRGVNAAACRSLQIITTRQGKTTLTAFKMELPPPCSPPPPPTCLSFFLMHGRY